MNKQNIIKAIVLLELGEKKGEVVIKSTTVELQDSGIKNETNSKIIYESMLHGAAVAIGNALDKGFIHNEKVAFEAINKYIKSRK